MSYTTEMSFRDAGGWRRDSVRVLAAETGETEETSDPGVRDGALPGAEAQRPTLAGRLRGRLDAAVRAFARRHRASDRAWQELEAEIRARALSRAARHHLPAEDAEDVASEACLRLLTLFTSPQAERIARAEGYVHRVIENLCKEQIRREKPVWSRLRGEIVETLRGRRAAQGFALWRENSVDLAGYALWQGRPITWTGRYTETHADRQPLRRFVYDRGISLSPSSTDLPALLAAVLDWVDTPLPVNEMTSLCFDLLGLHERADEPVEQLDEVAADGESLEQQMVRGALLREAAAAFARLPREECAAFLFQLQPDVAEQMLLALAPAGRFDAAVRQLAALFGMRPETLEKALETIPWSDLETAMALGLQRPTDRATQLYMINRRQRAIRVMRRCIERAEA